MNAKMTIEERLAHFGRQSPQVHPTAYVAPQAVLIGAVTVGEHVSILPCAVIRADINTIEIGSFSNIQDGAVLHLSDDYGIKIGSYVTVGHAATLHACTVEDECLIGMGSTILDGSVIGRRSIIAAGTVVTPGTIIPPGSMVMGVPGKVVRALTPEQQAAVRVWAQRYVSVGTFYKEEK